MIQCWNQIMTDCFIKIAAHTVLTTRDYLTARRRCALTTLKVPDITKIYSPKIRMLGPF